MAPCNGLRAFSLKMVVAIAGLAAASICHAQTVPGDVQNSEFVEELIGAPVYASDGVNVGTVLDISIDDDGDVGRIRVAAAAKLGLGARLVEVPKSAFMQLRGAVVLDMPAEAVNSLPEFSRDEATQK